ncbi:hypothetical protein SADUNF_Sadunf10G0144800 [Salix dunnii]|uniref:Protein EARLY FLOWERING 4 domain-containing protein n=1 Tax=Salix dunnii TaxID=1413687 RepID=A0A835JUA2_9ROSI|nr:hypothetical protein SADUNF_Sadunf10G0144800 [Salix dunnii]
MKSMQRFDQHSTLVFDNSVGSDRNRVLSQQVNENHQSMISDNMVKNVALIQELNGNISKVAGLYSDLISNFSTAFHHRDHNGKVERRIMFQVQGGFWKVWQDLKFWQSFPFDRSTISRNLQGLINPRRHNTSVNCLNTSMSSR